MHEARCRGSARLAAWASWTVLGGALLGCAGRPAAAPRTPALPELRIADADFDRDPRAVSSDEAIEDLARAEYVFDQAYAGEPAASAPRVAAARELLRERPTWTPEDLARTMLELFWRPDGHLAFGYGGRAPVRLGAWPWRATYVSEPLFARIDGDRALLLGDRPVLGCDVDGPSDAALLATTTGAFRLGVFHARAEGTVRCAVDGSGGAAVAPVLVSLASAPPIAPAPGAAPVELSNGEVPVLAIHTFDNAAEVAMRALPRAARRLRAAAGFVVDLRGNTGGNYAFAERFLLELTDAELLRLGEREVVSIAAAEGRANTVRRRIALGDVPVSALPHFTAQLAAIEATTADLRAQGAPRADVSTEGATVRGRAPGPLRARGVFLVDGGCASACEMMLALARQIPGVLVVGQNTRGGMAFGEVALFRLPRSGVLVSLGTRAFEDPLGDFLETRGFVPDVWLEGDDPLADARRMALERPRPNPRTARRWARRAKPSHPVSRDEEAVPREAGRDERSTIPATNAR